MKMILLVLFALLLNCVHAESFSVELDAVVRSENDVLVTKPTTLKDLTSLDRFEGKFFKIVKGKSDEAVAFSDNQETVLKAATVYHHLTLAREFFEGNLPELSPHQDQMVIRIEMANQFSELAHFANDNFEPQYNNALSIPEGKGIERYKIKPWSKEIWFRPVKEEKIPSSGLAESDSEISNFIKIFKRQFGDKSFQEFLVSLLGPNGAAQTAFTTYGSSLFMIELAAQGMESVYHITKPRTYFLDTAMVPEIIYHEYAHIKLSSHLELSHSSPVIEGFADYFAATIANKDQIANKLGEYARTIKAKKAKSDRIFKPEFETNDFANIDFVLALLWPIKSIAPANAHQIIFESAKNIKTSSNIKKDLLESLLRSCRRMCPSPPTDRLRLLKHFHELGL